MLMPLNKLTGFPVVLCEEPYRLGHLQLKMTLPQHCMEIQ